MVQVKTAQPVLPEQWRSTGPVPRQIGAAQRVAWLMRQSRLHGAEGRFARQRDFATALGACGVTADVSRISRWERTLLEVPRHVLRGYEQVLGLPPYALVAISAGEHRAREPRLGFTVTGPETGMEHEIRSDRIYDLLELALARSAHGPILEGGDWLELAILVQDTDILVFPRDSEGDYVRRLIQEMMRAVGAAYVTRIEALRVLLRHPRSCRLVTREIGRLVTDPHAGVVAAPVTLLAELEDPRAAATLLRMLEQPGSRIREAAGWAIASRVKSGRYDPDSMEMLCRSLVSQLTESAPCYPRHLVDVLASLEPEYQDRVVRKVPGLATTPLWREVRDGGAMLPAQVLGPLVAALTRELGRTVGGDCADDPVLGQLVSEAMSSMHEEERHLSSLVLMLSPFRRALADAVLDRLEDRTDPTLRRQLAQALGYLVDGSHHDRLLALAESETDPGLLRQVWLAVAHTGRPLPDVALYDAVVDGHLQVQGAMVYALGMSGSPVVGLLADHDDQRLAGRARWWQLLGSAVSR